MTGLVSVQTAWITLRLNVTARLSPACSQVGSVQESWRDLNKDTAVSGKTFAPLG